MATLFIRISFTLLVMETLIGTIANGFIVLVNYIDWLRSRKLSSNDLILTCLGLSRLAWQTVVVLNKTLSFFSLGNLNWSYLNLILPIMWLFTYSTSIWFATWLSVFYFAKIAIFSHPVFLQVKQRISGMVPWLLLGSVIFSAMMAIITVMSLSDSLSMCDFYTSHLSVNDSKIKMPYSCEYLDTLANVPNFIPFLIFLSSSIMLIISLWKHTRCLQQHGTGTQDLNTQVHLTAIKALASFFVLFLSSFVAITSYSILSLKSMGHNWASVLLTNMAVVCPSGHAIILILINPKLKQAWVRMRHHFKCC